MAILTKTVMTETGQAWDLESEPVAAAGLMGMTTGLHTMSFTLHNFVGRICVVATLENTPEEADANDGWFPIDIGTDCKPWVEFPVDCTFDYQKPGVTIPQTTGTFCETFIGNFTYFKVGMYRSYIKPDSAVTPGERPMYGNIVNVLVRY